MCGTCGGHCWSSAEACCSLRRPVANALPVQNRAGFVALDQLRTVDGERLVKRLGRLSSGTTTAVLDTLQEMFEE